MFLLFEPYVRFHIFIYVRVTDWSPIGKYLLISFGLRYVTGLLFHGKLYSKMTVSK